MHGVAGPCLPSPHPCGRKGVTGLVSYLAGSSPFAAQSHPEGADSKPLGRGICTPLSVHTCVTVLLQKEAT